MNRIGVFGGTFDPIHIGHLYIAYEAKRELGLDKIIFMPSGNPPHKQEREITDSNIRYLMAELAIKEYEGFEVSDFEVLNESKSYTYKTLKHLKDKYPHSELYFITGGDCLIDIEKWKNVNEILSLCKFTVFNRPGYSKEEFINKKRTIENKYDKEILFIDIMPLQISSTIIRERIYNNLCVKFFLDSNVYNYIFKNNLYKKHKNFD